MALFVASIASPVAAQSALWPAKAAESHEFFDSIKPGSFTRIPKGTIEVGESDRVIYSFKRDGKSVVCTGDIRRSIASGTQIEWDKCGEPYEWFKEKPV